MSINHLVKIMQYQCVRLAQLVPSPDGLLAQANGLVGGPDAILVIDDKALLKKGTHSVGELAREIWAAG